VKGDKRGSLGGGGVKSIKKGPKQTTKGGRKGSQNQGESIMLSSRMLPCSLSNPSLAPPRSKPLPLTPHPLRPWLLFLHPPRPLLDNNPIRHPPPPPPPTMGGPAERGEQKKRLQTHQTNVGVLFPGRFRSNEGGRGWFARGGGYHGEV